MLSAPRGSQTLAAAAVITSAINIGGGFTITSRMLNMFKRPGDPTEHNYLYAVPAAVLMGGYGAGYIAGAVLCCCPRLLLVAAHTGLTLH